jgi:tetratricopeptide (TPR) repeat protein
MRPFDRKEWVQTARRRLGFVRDGTCKMRKGKSKRLSLTSNFLEKAPTLHIEDDAQHYIMAAEAFLIVSKWRDAAIAYGQAAGIYHLELNALNQAASLFTEAGLVASKFGSGEVYFSKLTIDYSSRTYQLSSVFILMDKFLFTFKENAISIYCDCQKYRQAARIRKWIAETEEESGNYEKAASHLQLASQYYKASGMYNQILECQRKIGFLLVRSGKYIEASEAQYEVAQLELLQNLTKYSSKHTVFRAILLLLARDDCDFDHVWKVFQELFRLDLRFEKSVGCIFFNDILDQIKNTDGTVHEFADHIFDYNEHHRLHELDLDLLNRVFLSRFAWI